MDLFNVRLLAGFVILERHFSGLLKTVAASRLKDIFSGKSENNKREAGISYAGAGRDPEEVREPAVPETRKGRVIIIAYGSESCGIPECWAATPGRAGANLLPDPGEETVKRRQGNR